ncbi:MAG: 2TM domain-containing protein [Byssovorax sp.]
MTTPKPTGLSPLPVSRPPSSPGLGVSHDELLETARSVSQRNEEKIVERKRELVAAAEAMVTREQGVRSSRRSAFLLHLAAWAVVNGALASVVSFALGGTWFIWPLAIWSLALTAHGGWLVREQDRGVAEAEKALAAAREELDKYVLHTPGPPRASSPSNPSSDPAVSSQPASSQPRRA